MKKNHDLFIASIALLLNTVINTIENKESSIYTNSETLLKALKENNIETESVTIMIKKVYITISSNLEYINTKNTKLFSITEKKKEKNVKITIIPGIDLEEAFNKSSNTDLLWKYVISLYIASYNLIFQINKENTNEYIIRNTIPLLKGFNPIAIMDKFYEEFPDNIFLPKEVFNPYAGIKKNGEELSIENIMNAKELANDNNDNDINNINNIMSGVELLTGNKLNDILKEQLKTINDSDLENATEKMKEIFGDTSMSKVVDSVVKGVYTDLKNADLDNVKPTDCLKNAFMNAVNKAKPLIQKHNLNKEDQKKELDKIMESTEKLTRDLQKQSGNANMMGFDPMSLIKKLMPGVSGTDPNSILKNIGLSDKDIKKLKKKNKK